MTFLNRTITPSISENQAIKKYKNKNVTLDTYSLYNPAVELCPTHTFNSISTSERPCLCTSRFYSGSITLETAIALPIFMLTLLTIIYIINIMYLQITLQIALEETVRNISQTAYITSEFYSLTTDEQDHITAEDSSIMTNIGTSLIGIPYIQSEFLTDEIRTVLDNTFIVEGSDGISFLPSSIDMNENIMDIILTYKVTIPFIPGDLFSFNLVNRCYVKMYMGKDMEKEQSESFVYIYYTVHGKVFHTNKYCQYLLNYSRVLPYRDAVVAFPLDACRLCATEATREQLEENNTVIYLTSGNNIYHITLDCQSFTGDIFRTKKSSLEGENICEECQKGK